jgi:hypothetical protein
LSALWFVVLLGRFLGLPAVPFKEAPIRHAGIEHLQGAAAVRLGLGNQFWHGDVATAINHHLAPSGLSLEALRDSLDANDAPWRKDRGRRRCGVDPRRGDR